MLGMRITHFMFAIGLVTSSIACEAVASLRGDPSVTKQPSQHLSTTTQVVGIPYDSSKEFFVAPNGKARRAGTKKKPWNLQTALSQPTAVEPGSTIWLRGGVYAGQFTSNLRGTADEPIIVRQYPGEHAIIDGATIEGSVLTINGAYAWYIGFEVTNSNRAAQTEEGVTLLDSSNIKLINLVIHDHAGNGIGAWSGSRDSEIYGCLSFLNGREPTANHAYGLYGQNKDGEKFIENCIFIQNFGNYPIHIYGSELATLDNFRFIGNVFSGGWALIGGHTRAENPIVDSNFFYGDEVDNGIFDLGWQTDFGPGVDNGVVTNNYFMGGKVSCNAKNTNTVITGNTFYGRISFDGSAYPDNAYYIADYPNQPTSPSGLMLFVRPNRYERGRGNVIVYNWERSKKISIDLSAILNQGDRYEIRDAQNYLGAPIKEGIYDGGLVRVKIKRQKVSIPISVPADRTAPLHTTSEFGVFVVSRIAG